MTGVFVRTALAAALLLGAAVPSSSLWAATAKGKQAPAAAASTSTGGGLDFADQKSGNAVEIYADQGLELSQDAKTVIARVNAKAIRGKVTLNADVLIAHYRDKSAAPANSASRQPKPGQPAAQKPAPTPGADGKTDGGGSEIWRVEAIGHVTISTPTQTVYGDRADYNIDDAVVVLTGNNLRMVSPTDTITARDSLEYWEQKQQAVARGNAVAVRADKRLQADILVADFDQNDQHQMAIQRAHAYDHVILTTPREVVTGDRGDYNVESGIVTVTGNVKMTRENNQLDGGYAVVNLNTGVSRVFPTAPGGAAGGNQRVKGLFVPQKKSEPGASNGGAGQ